MPIRGLTDRGLSFPEIGRIRKGAKKTEANKPGEDLDYFRVEFDAAETEAAERFVEHFGDKPKEIEVMLPFNTVDENFEAWREAYLAGGLVHRCEGPDPETGEPGRVFLAFDPSTGAKLAGSPRDGLTCDGKSAVATYRTQGGEERELFCKPAGRLRVLIPALRRLAFLTALTGSIWDCYNLSRQIRLLLERSGRLVGIPLIFRRRMAEVSQPRPGGKRVRAAKSLLSVEADPRWVETKILAMLAEATPVVEGGVLRLEATVPVADEPETEAEDDAAWPTEEALMSPPSPGPAAADASPAREPERTSAAPAPSGRPYPPDTLIEKIKSWTMTAQRQPLNVTPLDRKAVKIALGHMFAVDPLYERAISALVYQFFEVRLLEDLAAPAIHTLKAWMNIDDRTGLPTPVSRQEGETMIEFLRSTGKL